MEAQTAPLSPVTRRRLRQQEGHPRVVGRGLASPGDSVGAARSRLARQRYAKAARASRSRGAQAVALPSGPQDESAALRQARERVATLERALAQALEERDLARLDVTDLRVRHVRLSTQLLALQQMRAAAPAVAAEVPAQVERLRLLEERNRSLEQDVARLRGAIETLRHVPAPAPPPRQHATPWYKRFWLAVIGKDARAAQWSAPESAP